MGIIGVAGECSVVGVAAVRCDCMGLEYEHIYRLLLRCKTRESNSDHMVKPTLHVFPWSRSVRMEYILSFLKVW